jgi:glycosyltransferase involved in cell wall biosynthesis
VGSCDQKQIMTASQDCLIILTPGFPKNEGDTTCLPFLQDFICELNESYPHLKLKIIAFDYPFFSSSYHWNGNEVDSYNGWKKNKFRKLIKWLFIWKRLIKIKRNNHVMGILSLWCGECAFLGNRFAKIGKLKHYCWIQGQDAKKDNKYVSRIKPGGEELIAISDYNRIQFESNHSIRPKYTIPVGIRPVNFSGEMAQKDNHILGVGSLIQLKQYHLFIKILSKIRKNIPEIKAVLSGKGPEENSLKALIKDYQLGSSIVLTGELPHDKILLLMKRSKIFLHTSNYEGLSVACLEALASGCQIISFLKPMQNDIEHWHVVQTPEEMLEKTIFILNSNGVTSNSVIPFTMRKSVQNILALYNYSDSRIF